MKIEFEIDGTVAVFSRNAMTGRAELTVDDATEVLASPRHPATRFSWSTQQTWTRSVRGHTVEITKIRPRLNGGLRANTFLVSVDRQEVARVSGK